jgi:hypothetical protein
MTQKSLSNFEIKDLVKDVKFVPYDELARVTNLKQLMGDNYETPIALLYLTTADYGHWVCLFRRDNKLSYFDSLGTEPDDGFKHIDPQVRIQQNEVEPKLFELLHESGMKCEYNNVRLQAKGMNTCGRFVVFRLWNRNLSPDQFLMIFDDSTLTPDELVVKETKKVLGSSMEPKSKKLDLENIFEKIKQIYSQAIINKDHVTIKTFYPILSSNIGEIDKILENFKIIEQLLKTKQFFNMSGIMSEFQRIIDELSNISDIFIDPELYKYIKYLYSLIHKEDYAEARKITSDIIKHLAKVITNETVNHIVKNKIDHPEISYKGAGIFKRIANVFTNSYSPAIEKWTKQYGDWNCKLLTIVRTPVESIIKKVVNAASLGKFNEYKNLGFDDIYHLSVIIELQNPKNRNEKVYLSTEKRPHIVINKVKNLNDHEAGSNYVKLGFPMGVTLNSMFANAERAQGKDFFKYSNNPKTLNNCQRYIQILLNNSGVTAADDFIFQDISTLLPKYTAKIANFVTDAGHFFNRIGQVFTGGEEDEY